MQAQWEKIEDSQGESLGSVLKSFRTGQDRTGQNHGDTSNKGSHLLPKAGMAWQTRVIARKIR